VPDALQPIIVSDSGCDQTVITRHWTVIKDTGRTVTMKGAFEATDQGDTYPVVTAVAKLTTEDGSSYAAIVHEALLCTNDKQVESLLSVHQVCYSKYNAVDDRARCERDIDGKPGTQSARFNHNILKFFFDGSKCFFVVSSITNREMNELKQVVLTDGSRPYNPVARSCRRRSKSKQDDETAKWKCWLGFIPNEVVLQTLRATTQYVPSVEAETREIMREHLQSRLPQLKLRRVNDRCFVDTFFASIPSVRGYKCWNLFSFENSGLNQIYLMRSRNQSPTTLSSLLSDCGIPRVLKSDNAPEFKGKRWSDIGRKYCITSEYTEAYHPNQNLAERRGGALKAAVVHLMTVTKAPNEFWCYALEYMCYVLNFVARRSLGWRTPYEKHWGDTPDISMFRFVFWQPVWYHTPRRGFPSPKMMKARFLGFAPNTGDAFCFLIITVPTEPSETPCVLARSIIRSRSVPEGIEELSMITDIDERIHEVEFYKNDNVTVLKPPEQTEISDSDMVDHIVGQDTTVELRELCTAVIDTPGSKSSDPFANGYMEVYGSTLNVHDSELEITDEVPLEDQDLEELIEASVTDSVQGDDPEVAGVPSTIKSSKDDLILNTTVTDDQLDKIQGIVTQEDDEDPELMDEVAHHLESSADNGVGDDEFSSIVQHEWEDGVLYFKVEWLTGDSSMIPFSLLKRDHPQPVAEYILGNKVGSPDGRYNSGRYSRWARTFLKTVRRVVRRLRSIDYSNELCEPTSLGEDSLEQMNTGVRIIRRVPKASAGTGYKRKRTKPGRIQRQVTVKYGVSVPLSVQHAYELDRLNGDELWSEAIAKEVSSLLDMGCFEFYPPDCKPSGEYQYTKLRMIFEVKQDGRRKARLVAGGHLVEPRGMSHRSTVVKGISIRLLLTIAHRDGLQVLTGDVSNAFITAPCLEKVYSYAGPEFGERSGSIIVLNKALYGLRSSGRAFRAHFAEVLRAMGFTASRYDRDVWMSMRDDQSGYDYICTHVDDFMVVARNPEQWIQAIKSRFLLKTVGPPTYYLGNNFTWLERSGTWAVGCATYLKECVRKIEEDDYFGGKLYTHKTPLPPNVQPELDDTEFLDENGVRKFQMLIGMAQWACTIGRLDISFAVSSLSRFSAAPRLGHLTLALHLMGYIKKHPNRRLMISSNNLEVSPELQESSFHPDFLEDYPDAHEEIDPKMSKATGREMDTSIFFDANFAHDQKTRRSITGIITFVGCTPVVSISKRQGCIATSTYCAEFVAMRTAVEEAIAIRYMLRCLGVPVSAPTNMYGDNFGVIQNATIPDSDIKKKHVAISYHYVREAITARIVNGIWIRTYENFADINTKVLERIQFENHVHQLMEVCDERSTSDGDDNDHDQLGLRGDGTDRQPAEEEVRMDRLAVNRVGKEH
jgi:Reverse transcriptase (RNA-dependent DNA polymerase)